MKFAVLEYWVCPPGWRVHYFSSTLNRGAPVHEYEPKTRGPEAIAGIKPPGGWRNPVVNG